MKLFKLFPLFAVLLFTTYSLYAQQEFDPKEFERIELTLEDYENICQLTSTGEDVHQYFPRGEFDVRKKSAQQSASFNVTYVTQEGGSPWPSQARNAFEYALGIWETHIRSSVPIRVRALWNSTLAERVLGSAGPTYFWQVDDGEEDTFYAQALASAITGFDFVANDPDVEFDINVNMNANFPSWYFGTDANTPSGQIDFVTVVLHELGHGLGFSGSVREGVGGSTARWGLGTPIAPIIYDRFVIDGSGNEILDSEVYANNSADLLGAVRGTRGGIYFAGLQTIANYDGRPVPLYAPSEWNQGSSYSHVDQNAFSGTEDALMRPQIPSAFAVHNPGNVVCTMFGDMGWPLGEDCSGFDISSSQLMIEDVEQGEIDFGVTNVANTIRRDITISNDLNAEGMMVARVAVSGGNLFRITSQASFVVLEPGENLNIPVLFRSNITGPVTGELSITYNGANGETTESIALRGEALEEGETFVLDQNYPNPFNSTTTIPYALSEEAFVRLDVFDALGRHVRTLVNEEQTPGRYNQTLQANDLSSGLFIYRIVVDGQTRVGKLLYTK